MEVLPAPAPFGNVTTISGMARGAIGESLDRISGAFAKLRILESPVSILINLVPADLLKEGTWLDLPLAIIMLQAAGVLPDLPEHLEGDFVLMGELGIHGEIRRFQERSPACRKAGPSPYCALRKRKRVCPDTCGCWTRGLSRISRFGTRRSS